MITRKVADVSRQTGKDFGFETGQLIQEFGYDDDVDMELRSQIEQITGEQLEDEDYRGAADGAIAWWRSDDGDTDDLADFLVDCRAGFSDDEAYIWLMVPDPRQEFAVPMEDVNEAASTAGLVVTTTRFLPIGWTAFQVMS
nr:DUF3052 family protein [Trueperella bonasi]